MFAKLIKKKKTNLELEDKSKDKKLNNGWINKQGEKPVLFSSWIPPNALVLSPLENLSPTPAHQQNSKQNQILQTTTKNISTNPKQLITHDNNCFHIISCQSFIKTLLQPTTHTHKKKISKDHVKLIRNFRSRHEAC